MKVLDPGHVYLTQLIDNSSGLRYVDSMQNRLVFVKREGEGYPGNKGAHYGTIIQDVLRCCIDRFKYLDNQIPHWVNKTGIVLLRTVIWLLEVREAESHGIVFRGVEGDIEDYPTTDNGNLVEWQR
jgi:hypothetical protein